MMNMNCIVCGISTFMSSKCQEVEAAFCHEHFPQKTEQIPLLAAC